jgi:hypothetical protein
MLIVYVPETVGAVQSVATVKAVGVAPVTVKAIAVVLEVGAVPETPELAPTAVALITPPVAEIATVVLARE